MRPLELANKYMVWFFSGPEAFSDPHSGAPAELFAEDLVFRGPFYRFDCREDYLASLHRAPPENCRYELIQSYETDTSACLVYRFCKPGVDTAMAQLFDIKHGRIAAIQLIFDTAAFD